MQFYIAFMLLDQPNNNNVKKLNSTINANLKHI